MKLNSGVGGAGMRGPAGHYYHPDAIAALRVVYEIHLIGEREREQQLYDLRSTMYFAMAISGMAASPYGTTLSMASWYNRSASARAPSKPMSFG